SGKVEAPIVIGRDHLDCGSVASPYRETEAMKDGSDAIADWPILNALLNTASGASWVSFHHGGGVGIGYSLHAGQVIVADGTIQWAGPTDQLPDKTLHEFDASGSIVLPGFVDSHTHAVFARSRADEFEWRIQGTPYMEILARGGGILSSVKAVRGEPRLRV